MADEKLEEGPAIPIIQTFLDNELTRLEQLQLDQSRGKVDLEKLNQLFRMMLDEVWFQEKESK